MSLRAVAGQGRERMGGGHKTPSHGVVGDPRWCPQYSRYRGGSHGSSRLGGAISTVLDPLPPLRLLQGATMYLSCIVEL